MKRSAPEPDHPSFGLAEQVGEQNDFVYLAWLSAMREAAVSRCRDLLDEETFSATWQRGRAMTAGDVFELAAEAVGAGLDQNRPRVSEFPCE